MIDYVPRAGSRAAQAIELLAAGPLTNSTLAEHFGCVTQNVPGCLATPIARGVIRKYEVAGLVTYALADEVTPAADDGQPVRVVGNAKSPSSTPSAEALAHANPFGLVGTTRRDRPIDDNSDLRRSNRARQFLPTTARSVEEAISPPPGGPAHPSAVVIAWAVAINQQIVFKAGERTYTVDAAAIAAAMNTQESA